LTSPSVHILCLSIARTEGEDFECGEDLANRTKDPHDWLHVPRNSMENTGKDQKYLLPLSCIRFCNVADYGLSLERSAYPGSFTIISAPHRRYNLTSSVIIGSGLGCLCTSLAGPKPGNRVETLVRRLHATLANNCGLPVRLICCIQLQFYWLKAGPTHLMIRASV
jgi:hypothetical protein